MSSVHSRKFSSRDYFSLEFIPFVTSTNESPIVTKTSKKSVSPANLTGEEASHFYETVISTPLTSKSFKDNSSPKKCPEILKSNSSLKSIKYTPNNLFKYAQMGDIKAIEQCLSNDNLNLVNQQDMYGWTPLMCATCEGHYSVVKLLLELGADLNIKNKQGTTAFDIAKEKKYFSIVDIFKNGSHSRLEQSTMLIEESKELYCNDCKITFKENQQLHERSITHLFNTRKSSETTFYHIPESNKGFQMLIKSGWNQNKGLGCKEEGRKFPIKTILKKDRSCIGLSKEVPRVTHFNANDCSAVKRVSDPAVKIVREKTLKKWQRAKLERKYRQKEIEFRRQFICDY